MLVDRITYVGETSHGLPLMIPLGTIPMWEGVGAFPYEYDSINKQVDISFKYLYFYRIR